VLLDQMADAAADGSPVNFMERFAHPLPSAVMGEMLGVPEDDREQFRAIGADFFNVLDIFLGTEAAERAHVAATAMAEYWSGVITDRRRVPRGDLATDLTEACDAGVITEDELLALLVFLFTAGYRTTSGLLGNATAQLLGCPAEASRLREDSSVAAAVVEESLRHETPSQFVPRLAGQDITVGGVDIPAGTSLIAIVGSANRDPARFEDPDRFDSARPANRPLSFGGGLHYCIGAALSRMEAVVALPLVFQRFPRLAIGGVPARIPALRMRLHSSLPVLVRG